MRASVSALFLTSQRPPGTILHECFTRSYTPQVTLCYAIGMIFYVDLGSVPAKHSDAACLFHNSWLSY